MAKLNMYLNFKGNTEEAFNFYKSVFGGEFTSVIRFKDMPMEGMKASKEDENKIMNINYRINENDVIMGSDALGERGQKMTKGTNFYIAVSPESKDEANRIFNALSAGGEIDMPMADVPWNAYYGALTDKYGVQWMVNYMYKPSEKKTEPVGARAAGKR